MRSASQGHSHSAPCLFLTPSVWKTWNGYVGQDSAKVNVSAVCLLPADRSRSRGRFATSLRHSALPLSPNALPTGASARPFLAQLRHRPRPGIFSPWQLTSFPWCGPGDLAAFSEGGKLNPKLGNEGRQAVIQTLKREEKKRRQEGRMQVGHGRRGVGSSSTRPCALHTLGSSRKASWAEQHQDISLRALRASARLSPARGTSSRKGAGGR